MSTTRQICLEMKTSSAVQYAAGSNSEHNLLPVSGTASHSRLVTPLYWVQSIMGKMREMEDAVQIVQGFTRMASASTKSNNNQYDFFGVYDGHGGPQIANKCRDRMHLIMAEEVLRRCQKPDSDQFCCWEATMVDSFKRLDAEVLSSTEDGRRRAMYDGTSQGPLISDTVGSTALVVVVAQSTIVIANCGNSRVVLSRGGSPLALSSDHKPNMPHEIQRMEQAGGKVVEWYGHHKCGAMVATSRSLGNFSFKPWVTCEPEVTVAERLDEDEFLILATDGLWNVIPNKIACDIVRDSLRSCVTMDVATVLTKVAIARGSGDNISVVVVQLSNHVCVELIN